MTHDEILKALHDRVAEMNERFGVSSIALFGSFSRNELLDDSDIDILVEFADGATFDRYFDLKRYLEFLLSRPVDLATPKSLKPRFKRNIERELIRVA